MSVDNNPLHAACMRSYDAFNKVMEELYSKPSPRSTNAFTCRQASDHQAIALYCTDNKLDIEDYIRTTASLLTKNGKRLLNARDFAVPTMMERYHKLTLANDGGNPKICWEIQETHLKNMVQRAPNLYKSAMAPLTVLDMPFDPWFRVTYPDPPIPLVMRIFGKLAWEEIGTNSPLRQYLRELRPGAIHALETAYGGYVD